jgi:hypothetical protein
VLVARAKVSGASRAQWKRVRSVFFGAAGVGRGRGQRSGAGFQRGHAERHADYSHLTEFKIRWWAIDDRAVCPV